MAAISYLLTLAQTVNASTGAILGQGLEAVVAGTSPPGDCIATVTAGSPVIAGANDYSVGLPMQFSGSFGTVTGLSAATTYYVIATGLSATQFEVSATPGGAAITPGGSASAAVLAYAIGAVEISFDQTSTALTDASVAGSTRALKKGEVVWMLDTLLQYLIRDTNVLE